jgi:hypothetical protein
MARGWESKSIESQQDDARREPRGERSRPPTPSDQTRETRRRTLELTRASAAADLVRATAPAHRAMLERALDAIDRELRELLLPRVPG